MIVKDWLDDVYDELTSGAGPLTSGEADRCLAAIKKHIPFKVDVVYMPVPRCETCRHWNKSYDSNNGDCLLSYGDDSDGLEKRTHPESKAYADVGGDEFGQPCLITTADFGCVQWEAKL